MNRPVRITVRDAAGEGGGPLLTEDTLAVELRAGPPAQLSVEGPATIECGTKATLPQLRVRVCDAGGNPTTSETFEVCAGGWRGGMMPGGGVWYLSQHSSSRLVDAARGGLGTGRAGVTIAVISAPLPPACALTFLGPAGLPQQQRPGDRWLRSRCCGSCSRWQQDQNEEGGGGAQGCEGDC